MKKRLLKSLILTAFASFFIPLISAQFYSGYGRFGFANFFRSTEPETIILGALFFIFFSFLFFILTRVFKDPTTGAPNKGIAGTISLAISLLITYGFYRSDIGFGNWFYGIGISQDLFNLILGIIFIIISGLIIWKLGFRGFLIILGFFIILTTLFTEFFYEKGIAASIGVIFILLGIILWRRKRRRGEFEDSYGSEASEARRQAKLDYIRQKREEKYQRKLERREAKRRLKNISRIRDRRNTVRSMKEMEEEREQRVERNRSARIERERIDKEEKIKKAYENKVKNRALRIAKIRDRKEKKARKQQEKEARKQEKQRRADENRAKDEAKKLAKIKKKEERQRKLEQEIKSSYRQGTRRGGWINRGQGNQKVHRGQFVSRAAYERYSRTYGLKAAKNRFDPKIQKKQAKNRNRIISKITSSEKEVDRIRITYDKVVEQLNNLNRKYSSADLPGKAKIRSEMTSLQKEGKRLNRRMKGLIREIRTLRNKIKY